MAIKKYDKGTRRAIIIGATSGIGLEIAKCLLAEGWTIGIAGRKQDALEKLQSTAPDMIKIQSLDITDDSSVDKLKMLMQQMGKLDLFLQVSGVGFQNMDLKMDTELVTARTNVDGFIRMMDTAFNFFKEQGWGHLAAISSVAGTKGLGAAPAYSATKRFQSTYIDALEQLSYLQKYNIRFTDIRPGFVKTNLLNDGKHYPMLMKPEVVAQKIVRALNKNKRIAIIDYRYSILVFFWRMIPPCIWKRLPIKTK